MRSLPSNSDLQDSVGNETNGKRPALFSASQSAQASVKDKSCLVGIKPPISVNSWSLVKPILVSPYLVCFGVAFGSAIFPWSFSTSSITDDGQDFSKICSWMTMISLAVIGGFYES